MDEYIIPDEFKHEIFYGSLSTTIDSALNTFNFSRLPLFEKLNKTEISNGFRAYLCYIYISFESDIEQYTFLRLVKTKEGETYIISLIKDYIKVNITSTFTDEFLVHLEKDSKEKYFSMLRNTMSKSYMALSKAFDNEYLKLVKSYIDMNDVNINPKLLLTLTKCAIIESRRRPALEREFLDVKDAIDYAYLLYEDQVITFKERKQEVEINKKIMEGIDNIIDINGFDRER